MAVTRDVRKTGARLFVDVKPLIQKKSDKMQRALARYATDDGFLRTFGERVISRIIERTQVGSIDRNSQAFDAYKESYINSRVFKLYGKSTKVNLRLTGRMQGDFQVLSTQGTQVVVGITDEDEAKKAHGHINGSTKNGLPKRDFFGLPDGDLERLFDSVVREFNVAELARQEASNPLMQEVFSSFLSAARRDLVTTQPEPNPNRVSTAAAEAEVLLQLERLRVEQSEE